MPPLYLGFMSFPTKAPFLFRDLIWNTTLHLHIVSPLVWDNFLVYPSFHDLDWSHILYNLSQFGFVCCFFSCLDWGSSLGKDTPGWDAIRITWSQLISMWLITGEIKINQLGKIVFAVSSVTKLLSPLSKLYSLEASTKCLPQPPRTDVCAYII